MTGRRLITQTDLLACAAEGLSRRETAERLGSTYDAVVHRAQRYSLKFRDDRSRPPSRAEPVLAALRAGKRTVPEIAAENGWPVPLTSNTMQKLADLQIVVRAGYIPSPARGRTMVLWAEGAAP